MASSVLGASLVPLFHSQQNKSFSSIASTKISPTNLQKINGAIAARFQPGVNEERKSYETSQNLQGSKSLNFSGEKPVTPILDTIKDSTHMKNLTIQELEELVGELRKEMVYTLSKMGGHLSSNLGVVELTVALDPVFDTPEDKIIWDVGHQEEDQEWRRFDKPMGFPQQGRERA